MVLIALSVVRVSPHVCFNGGETRVRWQVHQRIAIATTAFSVPRDIQAPLRRVMVTFSRSERWSKTTPLLRLRTERPRWACEKQPPHLQPCPWPPNLACHAYNTRGCLREPMGLEYSTTVDTLLRANPSALLLDPERARLQYTARPSSHLH